MQTKQDCILVAYSTYISWKQTSSHIPPTPPKSNISTNQPDLNKASSGERKTLYQKLPISIRSLIHLYTHNIMIHIYQVKKQPPKTQRTNIYPKPKQNLQG